MILLTQTTSRFITAICIGIAYFFLLTPYSFSQALDWSSLIEHSSLSTDPNDRVSIFDVVEDLSGNVLICGGYRGSMDFDPDPNNEVIKTSGDKGNVVNVHDIFVAKYSPNGGLLWVRTAGQNADHNNAKSLDVDDNGNVYVTGKYEGTVDFDDGPGVYNMSATSGDGDLFVLKFDPTGTILWGMTVPGSSNFRQSGFDLDVNTTANRMVIGARLDDPTDIDPMNPANNPSLTTGGEDAGILTYDLDGNFIYGFNYNDPSGGGWIAVEVDDNGFVYGFLNVFSFVDIDPGPAATGILGANGVILKFDPTGNLLWYNPIAGSMYTGAIELDNCDNIIIGGTVFSSSAPYDFGNGNPNGMFNGDGSSESVFVAKYTNDGDFTWLNVGNNNGAGTTRMGANGVNGFYNGGMALDKDGDIYITGSSDAILSFGALTTPGGSANPGFSDLRGYITKMDRNGVYQWTESIQTNPANSFGTAWSTNITVGQNYDVSTVGESFNSVVAPFGSVVGTDYSQGYTFNISQIIIPPDPEIGISQSTQCTSDTVDFSILNETPDSVFWDFGDPNSGAFNQAEGINTQHIFSGQGTFNVEAIVFFGCIPDTLDTTVTINSAILPINLGADTTLCAGETLLLDATNTSGLSTPSYTWSTGDITPTITVTNSDLYSVQVLIDNCTLEDSVFVTILPTPDAGSDATELICISTQDSLDLSNSLTSNQTGNWQETSSPLSNTFSNGMLGLQSLNDGNYSFMFIVGDNPNCPSDTALITVEANHTPNAGPDSSDLLCTQNGSTLLLNEYLSTSEMGTWNETSASGQFNNGTSEFTLDDLNGTYTFQYTVNGIGACMNESDVSTVDLTLEIQQNAGDDIQTQICQGEPDLNLEDLLMNNSSTTGTWSTNSGTPLTSTFFSTNTTPDVYDHLFVVGTLTECLDTASISVVLGHVPDAGLDNTVQLCSDDQPVDLISLLEGTPENSGNWTPQPISGTSTFSPTNDNEGTYQYIINGSSFCPSDTSEISIQIIDLSGLTITPVAPLCSGQSDISLSASLPSGSWSGIGIADNQGTFSTTLSGVGNHLITYSIDSLGCTASQQISITVETLPVIELQDALNVCAEETTFINADVLFADNISWNNGTNGTSVQFIPSYEDIGTSQIMSITASNNCGTTTDSIAFTIDDCNLYIYVPNSFTPDGDEYNQFFLPILTGVDQENYELKIFNRWGEIIFTSNDLSIGWDGTYNGHIVQDGVYIWSIHYKNPRNDERLQQVGHVSLIR